MPSLPAPCYLAQTTYELRYFSINTEGDDDE